MPIPIRFLSVALSVAFGSTGCGLLWVLPPPKTIETIEVVGEGVVSNVADKAPEGSLDHVEEGSVSTDARDVVEVNPEAVDFGTVASTTPARRLVSVANPRTFAVSVLRAEVVGPCFSVDGAQFPLTIAPGHAASIPVVLEAKAGSTCEATLILVIDSPGGRYAEVRLQGLVRSPSPA